MNIVAAQAAFVIGVDTHKDSHTAALLSINGIELDSITVPAEARGYRQLLEFAERRAAAPRVWAVEGTGSYGSRLTEHLLGAGEKVVEVDRPKRPARRNRAKSDQLDAVRAAREALAQKHSLQPRQGGQREALRVLLVTREAAVNAYRSSLVQLKSLVSNAPQALRDQLRQLSSQELAERCTRSPSAACSMTPKPWPTSPAAGSRARATARSGAASSATWPAGSSACSTGSLPLTSHRSIAAAEPPLPPGAPSF
jgi:transposase